MKAIEPPLRRVVRFAEEQSLRPLGLWLANLKIAEDRIPSLYAVFHEEDAFTPLVLPDVCHDIQARR